jgi:hypothetical protein
LGGEQHELHVLPKGTLKTFSRDGTFDAKIHIDLLMDFCDFHLVKHDNVMVRLFFQTLSGKSYEWYMTLPTRLFGSFDDIEYMFLNMLSPPIVYHTLITNLTQICLKKN